MIRIKFEVNDEEEEEVTPMPIENENKQIKTLLSLNFYGNNNNNSCLSSTNLSNVTSIDNNVPKKLPAVVSNKNKKKPKQLGYFTTDSVALCSKSIKTEPAESSLSLTTQLNNSLNIQRLLRQHRIQNRFRSTENNSIQSIQQANDISMIPNGTQEEQSLFSTKIESIFSENLQKVPLSLDLSSLIPNLDSEETANYDTAEIALSLDQSSSSIPNGTQQQQSFLSTTTFEPIVPETLQEVPLSLDQSSSSISNSWETTTNYDTTEVPLSLDQSSSSIPNSWETTTSTATNCDITTTELFPGLRAGFGRRAKLNVCYSVPKEPKPEVLRRMKKLPEVPPTSTTFFEPVNKTEEQRLENYSGIQKQQKSKYKNLTPEQREKRQNKQTKRYYKRVYGMTKEEVEQQRQLLLQQRLLQFNQERLRNFADSAAPAGNSESTNDNDQYSGVDPSSVSSSTSAAVAAPVPPPPPEAVPLITIIDGKKPPPRVPFTLEERKARENERRKRWFLQNKANPKPVDPEVMAERRRQAREYKRKRRERWLATATPEQLELELLKEREKYRKKLENESEEQRERRLEQKRQYARTEDKQRILQRRKEQRSNWTPEQREKRRATDREYRKRIMEKKQMESQTSIITNKRKHCKKPRFELLDYDSEDCESNGQTIATTSLESTKPSVPSKKLSRPTTYRIKFKSKKILQSSTDNDSDYSD